MPSSSSSLIIPSLPSTPLRVPSSSVSSKRKVSSFAVPEPPPASVKRSKKASLQLEDDEKFKKVEGYISGINSAVGTLSNVAQKRGLVALEKFLKMNDDSNDDVRLSDEEVIQVTKKFGGDEYVAGSFLMLLESKHDGVTRARQWIRDVVLAAE
jgi:hypothetical protein